MTPARLQSLRDDTVEQITAKLGDPIGAATLRNLIGSRWSTFLDTHRPTMVDACAYYGDSAAGGQKILEACFGSSGTLADVSEIALPAPGATLQMSTPTGAAGPTAAMFNALLVGHTSPADAVRALGRPATSLELGATFGNRWLRIVLSERPAHSSCSYYIVRSPGPTHSFALCFDDAQILTEKAVISDSGSTSDMSRQTKSSLHA